MKKNGLINGIVLYYLTNQAHLFNLFTELKPMKNMEWIGNYYFVSMKAIIF